MDRESGGEGVRDVVLAEQLQLFARDQLRAAQPQPPLARIVPPLGGPQEREARHRSPPRRAGGEREHGGVVRVQHPHALLGGVAKQQPLVGIVRVDRRIAIEVVRRQVREHADVRSEMRAVVQLERRHLDGQPLIALGAERDVGEREADVPRGFGFEASDAQQMRDQGGGRRLAVRAGHRDAAHALRPRGAEAQVDLRNDLSARFPRGFQGRRVRRHAGRDHDAGRGADLRQVVVSHFHLDTGKPAQRQCGVAGVGMIGRVAGVHARALAREQPRGGDTAVPQPEHGDDAAPPGGGDHRTFNVARAIAAHRKPRM